MIDNQQLIDNIIAAIREKKGKAITIVDLSPIGSSLCDYHLMCEGSNPTQIAAICDSVREYVRIHTGVKPFNVEGTENALWIILDYGDILVHVFEKNTRRFYDLEHLWSDAALTELPDED